MPVALSALTLTPSFQAPEARKLCIACPELTFPQPSPQSHAAA
ncbi:hypothetical protein [Rubritalea tangerina]